MSATDDLFAAITADPESDAARLAYARHVAARDSERAAFIEHQVAEASSRRARRGLVRYGKDPLLLEHEGEWSRTIAKYAQSWDFDRGFIAKITIDPHLFLEYGEWLFVVAPIRSVAFLRADSDPFPMAELANSPLLARLDAIHFPREYLADKDMVELARSPHLGHLLLLTADIPRPDLSMFETFAATPATGKLLRLLVSHDGFPGETFGDTGRDDWWGAPILGWRDMQPEGVALEMRYGYLPWLHGSTNDANEFDAAYFVANGTLPVKEPGSPV